LCSVHKATDAIGPLEALDLESGASFLEFFDCFERSEPARPGSYDRDFHKVFATGPSSVIIGGSFDREAGSFASGVKRGAADRHQIDFNEVLAA
jgi:hypothetical protein